MDSDVHGLPASYQAPLVKRLLPMLWVAPLYVLAMFGRAHLNAKSPTWLWLAAIAGFILLVTTSLSAGFCKVTLYADRIERKTWFGVKTMKRSEIGKIRERDHGLSMLCYKYNQGDGIMLPKGIGGDAVWKAWMASLKPNANQKDKAG